MSVHPHVLLLNPPCFRVVEPYYDTPGYPRTAIAYLAGYLRTKNVRVSVLDCKFDRIDMDGAMAAVQRLQPDLVGITALTNEIKPAAELAGRIKNHGPSIKTIIGGVHVTAIPEQTLREFRQFDYGVVGEGEETLYELVCKLGNEQALAKTPGIGFLDPAGQYVYGGVRAKIADQDSIPYPAWDLFRPAEEYVVQAQRGCPYTCKFCQNPNGRVVRSRSVENVLGEIDWLVEGMGTKSIFFGDEIFTIRRERTLELCRGMIARRYNRRFTWWAQTHVRAMDHEIAQAMKDAGCRIVGLGIESGDEERLKTMGKGTNLDMIHKAVAIMKKVKLPFISYFILGQPNETYQSAKATVDFAVQLNPDLPIFGIMVPYPGTEIARMAQNDEGGYVIRNTDWNEFNKHFGDALEFKNLSRAQMERLQFTGYLKVFIRNCRFLDLLKFLWTYRTEGFAVISKQLRRTRRPT